MAEFDFTKEPRGLVIHGEYRNSLDIEGFSCMLNDPSYCYKFYWLEAIVNLLTPETKKLSFDEISNEMICNAWYSVREYHIHLSFVPADGQVKDGLEKAVNTLSELCDLPSKAKKEEILAAIWIHESELRPLKEQLTNMVPYRALAGFLPRGTIDKYGDGSRRLLAYLEQFSQEQALLPYIFGGERKLKRELCFHPGWVQMICDNVVSISGWIQYEKLKWLQNINPEVPGLVYKLDASRELARKLNEVRKLWEMILQQRKIVDVFTEEPIVSGQYDVDHFIPWSFVMNNELWDLMPMDSSLNSAKGNRLPQWDPFFCRFAKNQYILYGLIHEQPGVHLQYEACFRDNLHSTWARLELYNRGNSPEKFYNILKDNMLPIYDSAKRQGYKVWDRV